MAARYTPPRSRSREEHPDDVFAARTLELSDWAQQNTQLLVILGVALALIVGMGLYYMNYRKGLTAQASVELERIQQTLATGEVEAAKADLVTYLDRFGSTPYAGEARLLLGQIDLQSGQTDQAVTALQPSASDLGEPIGLQAAMLLAKAYEQSGDLQKAEDLYLKVADGAKLDFQVRNALDAAALIRKEQGDLKGAADLYQRILDGMDETDPQRGLYQMRLQEARTEAARQG